MVAAYRKALLANNWEEMPQHFITSSEDKTGRDEVLAFIDDVNKQIFSEGF